MKINKINTNNLKNSGHLQFHSEFKNLLERIGVKFLKVEALFNAYLPLYRNVVEGLRKIDKSAITAKIKEADKARDETYSGIVYMNKAALKHFDLNVKEAAKRLKIVFDAYGNLAIKTLNSESGSIRRIVDELEDKYAADAKIIGIGQWVKELKVRNKTFEELTRKRFEEYAGKSNILVKPARAKLDKAYNAIIERVNALVIVESIENYKVFVKTWNIIIDKYKETLSRNRKPKPQKETVSR